MRRQLLSKPADRKIYLLWAIALSILFLAGVLIYEFLRHSYHGLFTSPREARDFLLATGPWAPAIFMLMQAIQIIVAPIPGQMTGLLGGYLFGGVWGSIYSMLGSIVGFTAVFYLSRRFGRPLLLKFFSAGQIKEFDYLTGARGPLVFFVIFLLPAFPDDLVCYLAGLTKIPISTLVIVSILGRLPTTVMTSYMGMGMSGTNIRMLAAVSIVGAIVLAAGYWKRDFLETWVKKISQPLPK